MKNIYQKIWNQALPYLKSGRMKDFVIHTEGVVRAMEMLFKKEKGNEKILMPVAVLHDIGFSKVPAKLQLSNKKEDKIEALKLHLKYGSPIIKKILVQNGFIEEQIQRIQEVVKAHKFCKPREHEKQLLIDADTLADGFRKQFSSDLKSYHKTPRELYEYRKNNKFYTNTAKTIFDKELENRKKEFKL